MMGTEAVPSRTEDMLDFLIVGGGIAGLACAWKLRQVGHRVTLLEQNDQLWKCGETIHSIAAMTQILEDWGISDLISGVVSPVGKITFLHGPTGEEIGLLSFSGKVLESLPAGSQSIPYGELYRTFYDLAIQAGVAIRLKVKAVEVDPWIPKVTTADGETLTADVIIGADGLNSIVRSVFAEPAPVPGIPLRYHMNLHVPIDLMRQDEELAKLVDYTSWNAWLSDDCIFHGSLPGSNPDCEYSIIIYLPRLENGKQWTQFPVCDELQSLFEPRVQKIMKIAEFDYNVLYIDYEPLDNWVHDSGKVVLVGQAAHPILPAGLWDCTACLEDALTLSELFSLPATRSQTAMLLGVFEELRQPRCATIQSYSRRKRATTTMPRGHRQEVRNEILRHQLAHDKSDETNDDILSFYYSTLVQLMSFDAREAIQEWWVTFGRKILLRSPQPQPNPEEEVLGLEPILIAAEIEAEVLPTRRVSDVLMGECVDGAVSEEALHGRVYPRV